MGYIKSTVLGNSRSQPSLSTKLVIFYTYPMQENQIFVDWKTLKHNGWWSFLEGLQKQ